MASFPAQKQCIRTSHLCCTSCFWMYWTMYSYYRGAAQDAQTHFLKLALDRSISTELEQYPSYTFELKKASCTAIKELYSKLHTKIFRYKLHMCMYVCLYIITLYIWIYYICTLCYMFIKEVLEGYTQTIHNGNPWGVVVLKVGLLTYFLNNIHGSVDF